MYSVYQLAGTLVKRVFLSLSFPFLILARRATTPFLFPFPPMIRAFLSAVDAREK